MSLHLIKTIEVEPSTINVLAISPNEQLITSGNNDGKLCVYYTQSLQPEFERYNIGQVPITVIAWSPLVPATLILGDSLSRVHVLVLENRQDHDHHSLGRYKVAEIVDAGIDSISCIDIRQDLVAVGGNKEIRIMKYTPGSSLAFLGRLPATEVSLDKPYAHCTGSVHIHNDETLIATYNDDIPHGDIVGLSSAWNMARQDKIWGVTLDDNVKHDGILYSSLHKRLMVSTKVSGDGLDWYHFPSFSGQNLAKIIYRGTTSVDAFWVVFINDRHVVTFGNAEGCISILDTRSGLPLTVQENPPHEGWKGFCAMAPTSDCGRSDSNIVVVAFEPVTAHSQGYYGISLYTLVKKETPGAPPPISPTDIRTTPVVMSSFVSSAFPTVFRCIGPGRYPRSVGHGSD
ncbi:hypothetical protein OF83DRAFT_1087074 [Amylostereum chailletii]|nr:hypothetical protein OF83DRAFT_1087074 [Amylostereum chailletii]